MQYVIDLLKNDKDFSHLNEFEIQDSGYALSFKQYGEPIYIRFVGNISSRIDFLYKAAIHPRTHLIYYLGYMDDPQSSISFKMLLLYISKNFLSFDNYYTFNYFCHNKFFYSGFNKSNMENGVGTAYEVCKPKTENEYIFIKTDGKYSENKTYKTLEELYNDFLSGEDLYTLEYETYKQILTKEVKKILTDDNISFELDEEKGIFTFDKSFEGVDFKDGEEKVTLQVRYEHHKGIVKEPRTHYISLYKRENIIYFNNIVRGILKDIFKNFFNFEGLYAIDHVVNKNNYSVSRIGSSYQNFCSKIYWNGNQERVEVYVLDREVHHTPLDTYSLNIDFYEKGEYKRSRRVDVFENLRDLYSVSNYFE